jgi:hypothetical protein
VQRREGGLPRERRVVREMMTVVTARVRVQHRRIGSWAMRGPPVRMLRCKVGRPRQTRGRRRVREKRRAVRRVVRTGDGEGKSGKRKMRMRMIEIRLSLISNIWENLVSWGT